MGHALVALALPGMDAVHKVSIIPRGIGALGYPIQRPTEDRYLMTREELERKIAVLLGGRAAEKAVFGHLSTGAADDLARVTDIARSMVTRYGMDEALGYVTYDRDRPSFLGQPVPQGYAERGYSEETRSEEHTSELQSLMRISYAVFCLKKKKTQTRRITRTAKEQTIATTNQKHSDHHER